MSTINGKVCAVDGVAVDKVFSNGKQVYGRNMLIDSGFESGKTPSGFFWGGSSGNSKAAEVDPAMPLYPTPFGKYMFRIESQGSSGSEQNIFIPLAKPVTIKAGETWTYSYYYASAGSATGQASDYLMADAVSPIWGLSMNHDLRETSGGQTTWHRFVKTWKADRDVTVTTLRFGFVKTSASPGWVCIDNIKLEQNPAVSPWTPAPEDVLKGDITAPNNLVAK